MRIATSTDVVALVLLISATTTDVGVALVRITTTDNVVPRAPPNSTGSSNKPSPTRKCAHSSPAT